MATATKSPHRSTVTLSLPKSVPALIVFAQGIVTRMTGNKSFANPTPTLAVVTAAIDDLRARRSCGAGAYERSRRRPQRQARGARRASAAAPSVHSGDGGHRAGRRGVHHSERGSRCSQDARAPRTHLCSQTGARLRRGDGRRRGGGSARRTNGNTAATAARPGLRRRPPGGSRPTFQAFSRGRPCTSSTGR